MDNAAATGRELKISNAAKTLAKNWGVLSVDLEVSTELDTGV